MSNEQQIAYLLSIIHGLDTAIMHTMDLLPEDASVQTGVEGNLLFPLRTVYPALDPILEFKENLYEQLEALQGKK
jgi:hypothetical protein